MRIFPAHDTFTFKWWATLAWAQCPSFVIGKPDNVGEYKKMRVLQIAFLISITSVIFSCSNKKWDESTKPIRLEFKLVKDASDKNNLLLEDKVLIRNEDVADASASTDQNNKVIIHITFTKDGAKLFETITENNIKKQIAILLDGKIVSAPFVMSSVKTGSTLITIPELTPDKVKEIVAGILKYKDNSNK